MRIVILVLAVLAALRCEAILIRADRDDAEYVELATRYPSAILFAPGVEAVVIAPRWLLVSSAASATLKEGANVQAIFRNPEADLALVFLREPVRTEPAPIHRESDELDEAIRIVGHGGDRQKRAAINTIDRVAGGTFGARIKPLDDASDLQGTATEGEKGAPAFVEMNGRIEVAGLYTSTAGDWQTFVRLSHYASWIDDTMLAAAMAESRRITR